MEKYYVLKDEKEIFSISKYCVQPYMRVMYDKARRFDGRKLKISLTIPPTFNKDTGIYIPELYFLEVCDNNLVYTESFICPRGWIKEIDEMHTHAIPMKCGEDNTLFVCFKSKKIDLINTIKEATSNGTLQIDIRKPVK